MRKLIALILVCTPQIFAQGLKYGTYFGGSVDDIGHGIALDSFDNMYFTGRTSSANFPVKNAFQSHLAGEVNCFVAKLNSDGTLAWSTYLGGEGQDKAEAIVIDGFRNTYVTGSTNSLQFPVTRGVVQTQLNGAGSNAFVAKFNYAGKLLWSTYLGTNGSAGNSIALNSAGDIFIGGSTLAAGNLSVGYIAELNPTATKVLWSTTIGGSATNSIQSIALLGNSVYVAGYTDSTDFPTTAGAVQASCGTSCADYFNGFVAKVSPAGVAYATYLGGNTTTVPGTTFNLAIGITVDPAGDAFVTGTTNTIDFPVTSGVFQTVYGGTTDLPGGVAGCIDFLPGQVPCGDAYAVKLNPTGTAIDWATYLGGSTADIGYAILLDKNGDVWISGYTQSYSSSTHTPFPTTADAFQAVKGGGLDAFLSELSPDGSSLIYSTYYGGSDDEISYSLALDRAGEAYFEGRTISTDMPITPKAFQSQLAGTINVFVAKIQP